MLTRKQQWRKQKKCISRGSHDYIYEQGLSDDTSKSPTRASSEPTMSLLSISNLGRLWSTTGDLTTKSDNAKKSVHFGGTARIILIPSREEYHRAGIGSHLWWNNDDYSNFKDSAVLEIKNLMLVDDRIDCKSAQVILYQPQSKIQSKIKSKLMDLPFLKDVPLVNSNISSSEVSSGNHDNSSDGSTSSEDLANDEPIPLTHVRSEVDLKLLETNNSVKSNSPFTDCSRSILPMLIHGSPEKKSKHSNTLFNKYQDAVTVDATKIAHAQSSIRQHAVHPLAYICS